MPFGQTIPLSILAAEVVDVAVEEYYRYENAKERGEEYSLFGTGKECELDEIQESMRDMSRGAAMVVTSGIVGTATMDPVGGLIATGMGIAQMIAGPTSASKKVRSMTGPITGLLR